MKNLISALAFLLLTIPCSAEIIIVDKEWPYDFNNIQAAIDYSSNGDFIFVFPGTYTGTGNRDIDFLGKAITVRSIDPTDPYFVAATIIDCNGTEDEPHNGFNFHNGEDANSVLAGFTITNGSGFPGSGISCENSSSPTITNCLLSNNDHAGIFCDQSNPVITSCTISNSGIGIACESAKSTIADCTVNDNNGVGIYCMNDSNATIINCTITGNISEYAGHGDGGGGICCTDYSSLKIINCTVTGNTAYLGAGIYCGYESSIEITGCAISGNSAMDAGGGIYCYDVSSTQTITSCAIIGNSAENYGGGIYCDSQAGTKITNCTIAGNFAQRYGGGILCIHSKPLINRSIFWGNSDISGHGLSAQIYGGLPNINVWFSCIQDDNPNDASVPFGDENFNIDDDPCFVEPGFWDINGLWHDGDYHLLLASPCIDAGDPYYTYHVGDVDIDAQLRLMGRYIDIGADEFELSVIAVTKPRAGDVWAAGSTHEINWDSYDITGTVDISYSTNNGADRVKIDNVPDIGSFTWHLPGAIDSNRCLISVEPNVPVSNLICTPSGLFTIHPCPPGPPVASKWKSLGGDFDRAGLSQNPGPELGCIKWQFYTNGPVSASPTVSADGRIHLSCEDGNLYTLDANGQLLWSYDMNSPLLSSPSIGPDGSVFVGAENGTLYAFDVNGNLRWTRDTNDSVYSSPAVSADGNVYACSQDGTLYALGRDGSELWTFETAGVGTVTGAIFASPAIGPDGTVYIAGLYDPNLYALDANTGSVKWSRSFLDPCDLSSPKPRPFASPVVAADGTIYQTLLYNPTRLIEQSPGEEYQPFWYDSKLYAVNPNNGNIIWATNMTETATQSEQENPQPPEPNYWFKKYYVDIQANGIPPYPFTDAETRGIVRYYRVSNSSWSESALGPDGTIYVSFDDQYLRAVDPNGAIKWVTSLGWFGNFLLTVGGDGLIYAASDDAYLCVIDPDGKEIARFKGDNWLSFPVITADNTIIVSDANNTVWAIGGSGCQGQAAALHRPEDLNADWFMNFIDFAAMADGWLNCTDTSYDPVTKAPYCVDPDSVIFPVGDINRDQYVDFADLAELADRWLSQE